ncbi:polymer-forming cytoskeletal protein [Natrinema amylolyticum]|uniref:polymer-forming cytoskeletal protein n=1 Tax=Natrinema amylolyticum TaxID=2878679 RepID=UPI001CFB8D90|nr:polymer-forming cytoskeletal protein [Natrinema amylolyticum]
MVTVSDRNRDRGQLLLVGAITLAFIILGAVVVYNGVLATETLSSGPTGQSGSDAKVTNEELERGIQGVTHRGNVNWDENSASQYNSTFEDVVEGTVDDPGYSETYHNRTANSQPSITTVERVAVVRDARISTGSFSELTGASPIDLEDNESATNDSRRIGHLVLEIDEGSDGDVTASADTDVTALVYDGSGEYTTPTGCRFETPARVDLVNGEINGTNRDCGLSLIDPDESYEGLTVTEAGGTVSGSYELVARGSGSIDGTGTDTHGAWDVAVNVTYTSNEVSYTRTQRVPVYDDGMPNPLGVLPDGTCTDLDIDSGSPAVTGGAIIECEMSKTSGSGFTIDVQDGILVGDQQIDGDLDVTGGSALYGQVTQTENIDIDDGKIQGDIQNTNDITMDNGAMVDGVIIIQGDITMGTNSVVRGDVFSEGNVDIDGDSVVYGDVVAEGTVTVSDGTVHGTINDGVSDIDNHR